MPVLVDTNVLVALADASDPHHAAVVGFMASTSDVLLVPITVVPEVDYLVTRTMGIQAALAVLQSVRSGEFMLEGVTMADFDRGIELVGQYADGDIGFVDASIVAIAERLRITRILTLDRRHFGMVRPKHCPAFELVP